MKHRPGYPAGLFDFLAGMCAEKKYVWDVGCGNGQASVELTKHFDSVLATDASENQISHAMAADNVNYHVALAEHCPVKISSFDLICVAQAFHWFDFERFIVEVRRVAKPDAIFAIWTYGLQMLNQEIDAILADFYSNIVGPFWPIERKWVEECYATIDIPFKEMNTPKFEISDAYDMTKLTDYLGTWSAVKNYKSANNEDPVLQILPQLEAVWGDADSIKTVKWDLYLRVFKIS